MNNESSTLSENEAENRFLSNQWVNYTNTDIQKIKRHLLTVKYFIETQYNLEYYFTEKEYNYLISLTDLLYNQRSKTMIRYGTPCKYIKGLLTSMFIDKEKIKTESDIRDLYKLRFLSVFKNRDPKNYGDFVPYMTNESKLENSLSYHMLNEEGVTNLKELCWLLQSVVPKIEFCPILIKVIALSLIFLSKEESFLCLKSIMINDYNMKDVYMLRFKFRFSFEENKKIVKAFIESFQSSTKNIGREITDKFNKLCFDFEMLIEDMIFNFFFDYLNFTFLTVFFMCFMREGTKMFFRFIYAIFKSLKSDIIDIDNKDNVISTIKEKCFQLKDINAFLKLAFSYKINHYNNKFNDIKIFEQFKNKINLNYYIPTIDGESNIINDEYIFKLWNIFPINYSTRDAKLIYSSDFFERNLSKIYEICSNSENSCLNSLVLIETSNNEQFGLLMSTPFDNKRGTFYSPSYISLLSFKPELKIYERKKNENVLLCDEDKIIIGLDKIGPSLQIEKDLLIGFSYPSEVFGNLQSLSKDSIFQIEKIEIYSLY